MNFRSKEQVQRALENVERYEKARTIADGIIRSAEGWLDKEDTFLREFVPDAWVPRSFSVNYITGCPIHTEETLRRGSYGGGAWHVDVFRNPWKVTCLSGGESYPSNDFWAFYRSGRKDRSLLTGAYPDDGRGWRESGAEYKHWFIGYYCEVLWGTIVSGVLTLSRAYVLTGDKRYAHKAIILLDRIAEVYPEMDYNRQSMYADEFSPQYTGKIFNQISETSTVSSLCEAYDNVREAIGEDPAFSGHAGELIRHIEDGIVRAGIRGIYEGQVRSNYGGHQEALLVASLITGDRGTIDRVVDWVLNTTGEATKLKEMSSLSDDFLYRDKAAHAEGLNFALYNLLFREGIGWESSPGYCVSWVNHIINIARLLERSGVDIWQHAKIHRMLYWPSEMVCFDTFTPAIGDCGSYTGGLVRLSTTTLRRAYAHYGDPALARMMLDQGYYDEGSFQAYDDLFEPPLDGTALLDNAKCKMQNAKYPAPPHSPSIFMDDAAGAPRPGGPWAPGLPAGIESSSEQWYERPAERSGLLGGYGLVILRAGSGAERVAASIYYGRAATEHAHFDRLNLEVFAYGKKVVPDLGYPEHAAEGQHPPAWNKNTAAHTTVIVDERRQDTQLPGRLETFVAEPGVHLVEINAPETYNHTSEYRRMVALIEVGQDTHYLLDIFRVTGGVQHDYGVHGLKGAFAVEGLTLSEPQRRGTLAGEDVPYAELYDDLELREPHKGRSYYTYRGSGYSYLYDVQRGRPSGPWAARWTDEEGIGVRVFFAPSSTREAIVATARVRPAIRESDTLRYVFLRNRGEALSSQFITVMEPFKGESKIQGISQITLSRPEAVGLRVDHRDGSDYLFHCTDRDCVCETDEIGGIRFIGRFGFVRVGVDGRVVKLGLIGRGSIEARGQVLRNDRGITGVVTGVDYDQHAVEVELDEESELPVGERDISGRVAIIKNVRHATAYTVTGVSEDAARRRYTIQFGDDEFRVGRFVVSGIGADRRSLSTKTYLYLAAQGYYRGTRLVDAKGRVSLPIDDVTLSPHRPGSRRDGRITLLEEADLGTFFSTVGGTEENIGYIADFGPGDRFEVVPYRFWEG